MFVSSRLVIKRFVAEIEDAFVRVHGRGYPRHVDVLRWAAYAALEKTALSDCLYHDLDHCIMNVAVGQDVLLGKQMSGEKVSPREWLHFVVALLYFNIGYVRGICPGDGNGLYATGVGGQTVALPRGATGAALAQHATDRSKCAVRNLLAGRPLLDLDEICESIEYTRFPAPEEPWYSQTASYPGLVRAAHYIGAVAEPDYMRKLNALYLEFEESGLNEKLGFRSAVEFREGYAELYEDMLSHMIVDACRYLGETREGNRWIANMNAHLHAELHQEAAMGITRRG